MGTLAQIRAKHKQGATADVFGDNTLHVEYDLSKITKQAMLGLERAKDSKDPFEQFDGCTNFLLTIGVSWDLTDDVPEDAPEDFKPAKIPFTREALEGLGYIPVTLIALGVFEDMSTKNWSALSSKTA